MHSNCYAIQIVPVPVINGFVSVLIDSIPFDVKAPSESVDAGLKESGPSLGEEKREGSRPEYALIDALLELNRSEDSRVAIKACEGLLLCSSIKEDNAATVIVLYTALCEKMASTINSVCPML